MKKQVLVGLGTATVVTLGVFGGIRLDRYLQQQADLAVISKRTTVEGLPAAFEPAPLPAGAVDFRAAAKRVMPSVVSVDRFARQRDMFTGEAQDVETGTGSGVIISNTGLIVTNNHVVSQGGMRGAGNGKVRVRLQDKRTFEAKVLGTDERSDIAVLKIEASNLQPIELGQSGRLEVGQWVMAVGNPLGFDNTLSVGVISSLKRNLPVGVQGLVDGIQTDAAINPGNSGGPLFNADGQVVGINSQIYSQTGGYQGLAFAIPIDVALKVKDQIMRTGHAEHARLGVAAQEVDQALAESFGLKSPRGALITDVENGSPAQRAGLRAGDVILSLGQKKIDTVADLPLAIGQARPGDRVEIGYWRERHDAHATAELADARAKASTTAQAERGGREWGGDVKLGLALRPLTPGEREASGQRRGLLIEGVTGPAESAGVSPGDILIGINGQPVSTPDEVRAAVKGLKGSVALQLRRDDAVLFVPVQVG